MFQYVVALSTTKVEYIAITNAMKEVIWLQGIIDELGISPKKVTVLCDSQSGINFTPKHPMFHEHSKHINVKLHLCEEHH